VLEESALMTDPEQPSPDDPTAPAQRPDLWLPPAASSGSQRPSQSQTHPEASQPDPAKPHQLQEPLTPQQRVRSIRGPLTFVLLTAVLLALVAFGVAINADVGDRPTDPYPTLEPDGPPRPSIDAPETAARIRWQLEPAQLRRDLDEPEFVNSVSGDFDAGLMAAVDTVWLVITGRQNATATELTALDAASGTVLWRRDLDSVLCATEAPESGLLCASVLNRDRNTQLGTRWRLHRIDPRTGADVASTDIDAWATAVHYTGSSFVVLEQRRPAPHAVVRGYDADDLSERWQLDLRAEQGHASMFSPNRIIGRREPKDLNDVALDRPRLRDVGKDIVAVWAGQRTAFINRRSGKLIMMPHCTRPHDDGKRLWCNDADGSATAYSYHGRTLYQTKGVRLTSAGDDGIGRDINRPVFYDPRGAIYSVDLDSGDVGDKVADLGVKSTWAGSLEPSSADFGDHTAVRGEAGVVLLDPDRDAVLWRNEALDSYDLPVLLDGKAYFTYNGDLAEVDLTDGRARRVVGGLPGHEYVETGDGVAASGSEVVAAVELG
jgi:outer membrane protein assembly factor BamB